MLFLLDEGWLLLGALVGLLAGVVAQGMVQTVVAARLLGDRSAVQERRDEPDPRRHLDPFGVVVALIADPPVIFGKAVPYAEPRFGSKSRFVITSLSGSVAHLVLGLLFVVGFSLAGGDVTDTGLSLLGDDSALMRVLAFAGVVNLACAVLRLLPLPPLDGNRILWAYAPRTEGWRRARYWLEEQNVGLAILVVLTLPIFGGTGLLLRVVSSITGALLELLAPIL